MMEPRVLVGVSDPLGRYVCDRLTSSAIRFETTQSHGDTVARLRDNLYWVVVVPVGMQGGISLELIDDVVARDPLVQIVAVAADPSFGQLLECVDHGVAEYYGADDHPATVCDAVRSAYFRSLRWARLIGSQQRSLAVDA
jgi:DNA-binding NarL/FixJ family response regulator